MTKGGRPVGALETALLRYRRRPARGRATRAACASYLRRAISVRAPAPAQLLEAVARLGAVAQAGSGDAARQPRRRRYDTAPNCADALELEAVPVVVAREHALPLGLGGDGVLGRREPRAQRDLGALRASTTTAGVSAELPWPKTSSHSSIRLRWRTRTGGLLLLRRREQRAHLVRQVDEDATPSPTVSLRGGLPRPRSRRTTPAAICGRTCRARWAPAQCATGPWSVWSACTSCGSAVAGQLLSNSATVPTNRSRSRSVVVVNKTVSSLPPFTRKPWLHCAKMATQQQGAFAYIISVDVGWPDMTWVEARNKCNEHGLSFAKVLSEDDQTKMRYKLLGFKKGVDDGIYTPSPDANCKGGDPTEWPCGLWIGGNDREVEGTWKWTNGL